MGYNGHYFEGKYERAKKAIAHSRMVDTHFKWQTQSSINSTKVYSPDSEFKNKSSRQTETKFILDPIGTVEAIHKYFNPEYRMAALNFASYKNPGGMFMNGSKAQEECLCHESNLYNILFAFNDSYYKWNNANKNKALYLNRALYTPEVVFMGSLADGNLLHQHETPCDIITCAAPNYAAAHRYQGVQKQENLAVLRDRIGFVLDIAVDNQVDTLILGAFGCGVFGQDPVDTAIIFKEKLLTTHRNKFEQVIFAIPPSNGHENNLHYFQSIFGGTAEIAK